MRVAVIPARGGSKRIPRKNVKDFCGRPMIAWPIEIARRSACFDDILVSTDDEGIADLARELGASVPFIRPRALADDYAGTVPVIAHATRWLGAQGNPPGEVCCIYATAPFLRESDLQRGLALLLESRCDYAFSVTGFRAPIQRSLRITRENRVEMFFPEQFGTRSQDLEQAWHDAAQFYWGTADAWLSEKEIFNSDTVPVVIPGSRVQDIDTPDDWERAERMFMALGGYTKLNHGADT